MMYEGKWTKKAVHRREASAPNKRRRRRRRRRSLISTALFAVSLLVVLYASGQILDYSIDRTVSKRQNQKLSDLAVQTVPGASDPVKQETRPDSQAPSQVPTAPHSPVAQTEPTEPPREKAPILVDFPALKRQSPDIIGWLYCPGTPINYPVMRSRNNLDYIRMLPDGTANDAGSLFLDYRNGTDFLTGYSVIYGHNMKNDTMFGTLEEYKKQDYYDAHSTLYLITEAASYRVDLMAGVLTTGTSEYYALPMEPDAAVNMAAAAQAASTFVPAELPDSDRYLLLSTCSYESGDGRFILFGVLTEIDAP